MNMEWIFGLFSGILSQVFSKKEEEYKQRVEKLRIFLDEFEKGCVPMIKVENDKELINRANGYIQKWKGQQTVVLNTTLLDPMERLIEELLNERHSFWYKVLEKANYKIQFKKS